MTYDIYTEAMVLQERLSYGELVTSFNKQSSPASALPAVCCLAHEMILIFEAGISVMGGLRVGTDNPVTAACSESSMIRWLTDQRLRDEYFFWPLPVFDFDIIATVNIHGADDHIDMRSTLAVMYMHYPWTRILHIIFSVLVVRILLLLITLCHDDVVLACLIYVLMISQWACRLLFFTASVAVFVFPTNLFLVFIDRAITRVNHYLLILYSQV